MGNSVYNPPRERESQREKDRLECVRSRLPKHCSATEIEREWEIG